MDAIRRVPDGHGIRRIWERFRRDQADWKRIRTILVSLAKVEVTQRRVEAVHATPKSIFSGQVFNVPIQETTYCLSGTTQDALMIINAIQANGSVVQFHYAAAQRRVFAGDPNLKMELDDSTSHR
jgi:hypothetical protein